MGRRWAPPRITPFPPALDGLGPVPTAVQQEQHTLPSRSALQQNYPNPFNPSTTIQYSLAVPTRVRLTVHDLLGRRIRTLVDQHQPGGLHAVSWDGTGPRDQPVGVGVYLYRLETQDRVQTRKLVLLK